MFDINQLTEKIVQFSEDRDWDQFHTPKELAISISIEANELLECFQWKTDNDVVNFSEEQWSSVEEEIADVMNYLLLLSYKLGIDPIKAVEKKMIINGEKYPVEKAKGNAKKYIEFD
jgi:NTP pyrophosphatase (non-canonical NTP hydrolase)